MKYNNPLISVLVATYNRPQQLLECLRSLSNSKFKNFEVIIVDQSINNQANQYISAINLNFEVINIHTDYIGKAKALNLAINRARAEIFAFTDDDCIVDKNWLKEIYYSFHLYPKIVGVFGNTLPYKKTKHLNKICPSTFTVKGMFFHSRQNIIHYQKIGLGNNMAFRRSVFTKIGNFKPWLGPGNSGQSGGEESDIIFRILSHKLLLLTNSTMTIYHNRWISITEERLLQNRYTHGLMAFLGYYLFSADCLVIMQFIIERIIERQMVSINNIRLSYKTLKMEFKYLMLELVAVFQGLILGIYMSFVQRK